MSNLDQLCICGHPRSTHSGKTHRGVCQDCYAESDHGAGCYCSRFRDVAGTRRPRRAFLRHGH